MGEVELAKMYTRSEQKDFGLLLPEPNTSKDYGENMQGEEDLKARLIDDWNGPTRDIPTHIGGAIPICMYMWILLIRYDSSSLHNSH